MGKPAFVAIRVSSSKVYCTTPANQTPQLNLELMSVTGSLYESKTGRITLKIKNNGKEYNSLVPGPYLMNLYYWNTSINNWSNVSPAENAQLSFTLVDDYTGFETTESKSAISIYPVPVNELLQVKAEHPISSAHIYNIAGQLLLSRSFNSESEVKIDVSGLIPGSYIVRIHTSNGVEALRFVKQ